MGHANVPESALGAGEAGVCDVILHFRRRRGRTVRAARTTRTAGAAGAAILRASAAAITRAITTITGSAGAPLLARAALRAGTVAPRAAGFALLGSRAMTERMALQERVTLRTLAVVQAAVAIDIEVDPQRRRR